MLSRTGRVRPWGAVPASCARGHRSDALARRGRRPRRLRLSRAAARARRLPRPGGRLARHPGGCAGRGRDRSPARTALARPAGRARRSSASAPPPSALRAALPPRPTARSRCSSPASREAAGGSSPPPCTALGPRAAGPFVVENLAALPESLRETELFGTGEHPGLLAAAAGGTLYLAGDRTASRPAPRSACCDYLAGAGRRMRASLPPPGSSPARTIDLEEAARSGRFRRDLADRSARAHARRAPPAGAARGYPAHRRAPAAPARGGARGDPPAIAPEALAALKTHPWAGNVRELDEELARAGSGRAVIGLDDLPAAVVTGGPRPGRLPAPRCARRWASSRWSSSRRTLADANWNKSRAARILGLSRLGLQKKIDRYGIDRRR